MSGSEWLFEYVNEIEEIALKGLLAVPQMNETELKNQITKTIFENINFEKSEDENMSTKVRFAHGLMTHFVNECAYRIMEAWKNLADKPLEIVLKYNHYDRGDRTDLFKDSVKNYMDTIIKESISLKSEMHKKALENKIFLTIIRGVDRLIENTNFKFDESSEELWKNSCDLF